MGVLDATRDLVERLDSEYQKDHEHRRFTFERVRVHLNDNRRGKKFYYIDIGSSGAWLVEIETGEIHNIKGYGVPDYNKKKKADIGNVATVDAARMLALRFNYLR